MIDDTPSNEGGNKHHKLGTFMLDRYIYTLYIADMSVKVYNESGNPVIDDQIIEKVWKNICHICSEYSINHLKVKTV